LPSRSYEDRVAETLKALGIGKNYQNRPLFIEATDLVAVGPDIYGREQKLTPQAAHAWHSLKAAAQQDQIILLLVSAFRSFDYQKQIVQRKLNAGQSLKQVLQVSAAPGFSEHHSGRTVDLTTPGCEPLTEEFDQTPAFAWLVRRADHFGFRMSYPRDNPWGIIYEPWHWTFQLRAE
jgi:D-alanyl-D-alanine carboxypeptidase